MFPISTIQESGLADLVTRISAGRRGNLINVYRLLLHQSADCGHLVRTHQCGSVENEAVGTVTRNTHYPYRASQSRRFHDYSSVPKLALADGVSLTECEALNDWEGSGMFNERRAALAYADAMTRDVAVSDEVFAELRPHFDDRTIVELSVLIGTYNMHNRVMQALKIDLEKTA